MSGPPTRETRRLQGPAGQNLDDGEVTRSSTSTVAHGCDDSRSNSLMIRRRSWVYSMLRRCDSPPPKFGSAEWLALPEGVPGKVGAVVVAAESWARDGDNLVVDLARELDERRRLDKEHEDADYQARAAEHRRRWRHLRVVPERGPDPSHRPGDYLGRRPRGGDPDAA